MKNWTLEPKCPTKETHWCPCLETEWEGVQEALFFAQREMSKFPIQAQWFLNRLGDKWRQVIEERAR